MARVHRIGQSRVVHVYRLLCHGTIEERVVGHAEKKLYLAEHVNRDSLSLSNGDENDVPDEVDKQALLGDLKFGSDAVAMAEGNELLDDASLDAIIDRTRTGNETLGKIQVMIAWPSRRESTFSILLLTHYMAVCLVYIHTELQEGCCHIRCFS